jgi:hypothetical protein
MGCYTPEAAAELKASTEAKFYLYCFGFSWRLMEPLDPSVLSEAMQRVHRPSPHVFR